MEQCDEESVTLNSLVDIVDEEEQLVEDANAVLGGSDDKNCTYLMGYVNRQALYSCRTCAEASPNKESAGICLACSLECHEGHDLVELYTKRNFRCDCGNSKFSSDFKCKLCPVKIPVNEDNRYNQNYVGLYCTCSKPYPDPNDSIEDVMIQCIICEDWFHGRHTTSLSIDDETFEEMTCGSCMKTCSFLWTYVRLCKAIYDKKTSGDNQVPEEDIDIEGEKDVVSQTMTELALPVQPAGVQAPGSDDLNTSDGLKKDRASENQSSASCSSGNVDNNAGENSGSASDSTIVCRLRELTIDNSEPATKDSVFWPSGWRQKLCSCLECLAMYERLGVSYLLHEEDTIAAYEQIGRSKCSLSPHEQGMEALSNLNHVQKVELLQGYNDLKSGLTEYLKKFAENGKVVREEDVAEFFSQLEGRKRQRTNETPQYSCK